MSQAVKGRRQVTRLTRQDIEPLAREIAKSVTGVGPGRIVQAVGQIADALTGALEGRALSSREAILFRLIDESQARVKTLEEALRLAHEATGISWVAATNSEESK